MIYELSKIPADRRLETRRVVPFAPRQVFQAFADPTVLAQWWGPGGFTNTFHEFLFCDGGDWRFTMHSPDGKDFLNESRFARLVEPSLVVIDHFSAPRFQAHFAIAESPVGCKIDWCMVFEDAQTCTNVAKFAGNANEQNLDRLVAALTKMDG